MAWMVFREGTDHKYIKNENALQDRREDKGPPR